jgi:dihydroneopterin aldolase
MTKDRVFIEDLRIQTVIGIFDWEREITQTISIDLEMAFDIRRAAESDSIRDTLDSRAVNSSLSRLWPNIARASYWTSSRSTG